MGIKLKNDPFDFKKHEFRYFIVEEKCWLVKLLSLIGKISFSHNEYCYYNPKTGEIREYFKTHPVKDKGE